MKKLIALILILACVLSLSACMTKAEKSLRTEGPWGSQAIWADDYDQIYLLCTKKVGDRYATVTAYLAIMSDWEPMEVELKKGTSTICFNSDGQTIMEATATMIDGKLSLTNFQFTNGSYEGITISMKLSKLSMSLDETVLFGFFNVIVRVSPSLNTHSITKFAVVFTLSAIISRSLS